MSDARPDSPSDAQPDSPPATRRGSLAYLAARFALLGFTAFGGPPAHVALMEDWFVKRDRWLTREEFLDTYSAVQLMPGPNSTQLAIALGAKRAGTRGLFVAGLCFIVPAVLIILPLAYAYVRLGQLPSARDALAGINACVVAIVASAMLRFIPGGVKNIFTCAIALLTAIVALVTDARFLEAMADFPGHQASKPFASLAHALSPVSRLQPEVLCLVVAAIVGATRAAWRARRATSNKTRAVVLPLLAAAGAGTSNTLLSLALFFLKVGATLMGSGYVLASYLRSGVVEHHHWLTPRQLLDAIAVGQVTPGPLLTTATFIGYVVCANASSAPSHAAGMLAGLTGAIVSTAAIFAPSFVYVALLARILPRLRKSVVFRGALDAMNAAVVGLLVIVTLRLAHDGLHNLGTAAIAIASLLILLLTRVNATWLILLSAGVGYALRLGLAVGG